MTHQQIIDKLHKRMAESIDYDLHRIIPSLMNGNKTPNAQLVLDQLMPRWNCALLAPAEEVTDNYKSMLILTIALLLHKYGMSDPDLTERAIKAIDHLNDKVVTSDAFFRQTDQIKEFIKSMPKPLTRRPGYLSCITFYRAQDVISFQMEGKFVAAYVHENRHNEAPVVEFYDAVFDSRPTMEQLAGVKAMGDTYADGSAKTNKYAIFGLKDLPDYANQVHLIKASVEEAPDNSHLGESIGLWVGSDIVSIQRNLKAMIKR